MLKAVRGIYEGGAARPTEPISLLGRHEVIITFLDGAHGGKDAFLAAAGSWSDLDTEALKHRLYAKRSLHQRPQPRL